MMDMYTILMLIVVIIMLVLLIIIILISNQEEEDKLLQSDASLSTDQLGMKNLAEKQFTNIDIKDRLHGSNKLGMYNLSVHKYRDGYQGVIRGSSSDGCTILPPSPLFSYVFYVYFDNSGNIMETTLIDLDYKNMTNCKGIGYEYNGFEDPKMFIYKGEQWVVGNVLGTNEQADPAKNAISIFKIRDPRKTFKILKVPKEYNPKQTQKNWSFFEYENELYCEYSISPHVILKVDIEKGETTEIYKTGNTGTNVVNYGSLRGGANSIKIKLKNKDYYLNIGHINKDHNYKQFFYIFEPYPPFKIIGISEPSKLDYKARIQFAAGISEYNENIYVSYGVSDCTNVISIYNKDKITDLFPMLS